MTRTAYQKSDQQLPLNGMNENMKISPIQMRSFDYRTMTLESVTNEIKCMTTSYNNVQHSMQNVKPSRTMPLVTTVTMTQQHNNV